MSWVRMAWVCRKSDLMDAAFFLLLFALVVYAWVKLVAFAFDADRRGKFARDMRRWLGEGDDD